MWIVPSTCSVSAPDTEGLNWDSGDWGFLCERSLTWRGKDSQSRTWSSRWKRVPWMRLLSLRTLRPSHTNDFLDAWICSLPVTRVNRSAHAGGEPAKTTHVTSGHGSQMELPLADPDGSSSKTSKDTFRWDSPQSSATWKKWVTERRGEYSRRLKSAHRTNGSGSSSWGTPRVTTNGGHPSPQCTGRGSRLEDQVAMWPTAAARDWKDTPGMSTARGGNETGRVDQLPRAVYFHAVGHPGREKRSKSGKNPEQWATAHANCHTGTWQGPSKQGGENLQTQAKGKLNPNWVEQLMGLPVGWTQLSTAWTDCDCLETESSPPPQPKPSQPSTTN